MANPDRDTVYTSDGNRTVYARESNGTGWFVGIIVVLALIAIGYLVFSANSGTTTGPGATNTTPAIEAPAAPVTTPAPMTEAPAVPDTSATPMTPAPASPAAPAVEAPANSAAPAATTPAPAETAPAAQ